MADSGTSDPVFTPDLAARCVEAARAARSEPENHCANAGRFVDGELTPPDAEVFRAHLVECATCREAVATSEGGSP